MSDPTDNTILHQTDVEAALADDIRRAISEHDTILSSTYGTRAADLHAVRVAEIRTAKGGRIGTNGKGVIAWRADHQLDQFRASTWPILRDRGMPCSLGVLTRAVNSPADPLEPTTTTWAQLRTTVWEGVEVWAHSMTHTDPSPGGPGESLYNEVVKCKTDIEANQLRVFGFQMPGVVAPTTPKYSGEFRVNADYDSEVGALMLAHYGLHEINSTVFGARRRLPASGIYIAGVTSFETMTLANAKANVDFARDYGGAVVLAFHPKNIVGTGGYMSLADFTALADYVKAMWDAGDIEVLTPSGAAFADPGSTTRLNLLRQSDFEATSAFAGLYAGAWLADNATGMSIETTGGASGAKFLRIAGPANYGNVKQSYTEIASCGLQGATFALEAKVRQSGAVAAAQLRLRVVDMTGVSGMDNWHMHTIPAGSGWTTYRHVFTLPTNCTNIEIRVGRWTAGTGDIDIDDIRCVAI